MMEEMPVTPVPCTKGIKEHTVREWLAKLDSEVTEFKEAVLQAYGGLEAGTLNRSLFASEDSNAKVLWEKSDIVTVLASMMCQLGFSEDKTNKAQQMVNQSNHGKGRW